MTPKEATAKVRDPKDGPDENPKNEDEVVGLVDPSLDPEKAPDPGPVTITRTVNLGKKVTQEEIVNVIINLAQTAILHGREGRKEAADPEYSVAEREGQKYLEYKMVFKSGKADVPSEEADGNEVAAFVSKYVDEHLNLALKALVEKDVMVTREDDEEVDETVPA